CSGQTNTVVFYQNSSTPGFLSLGAGYLSTPFAAASWRLCIGDLNGDGKPDIALCHYSGGPGVTLFQNRSSPRSISLAPAFELNAGLGWGTSVGIGDLDGDGRPDLVATGEGQGGGNKVALYRNVSRVVGA